MFIFGLAVTRNIFFLLQDIPKSLMLQSETVCAFIDTNVSDLYKVYGPPLHRRMVKWLEEGS